MDEKIGMIVERTVKKILSPYPIPPAIEVVNYVNEAVSKIVNGIMERYKNRDVNFDDAIEDLMRYLATDRNFSPSDSLRLLGDLKKEIRKEFHLNEKETIKLYELVDEVLYKAFEFYYSCRAKIFELRLKEKDRDLEIMRRIIEFSNIAGKEFRKD
ncbi:MAG: hypothetical protein QXM23_00350 [Archaeoglobaceae archaeon]|uniref:RsbT co-antagonist protein RsbRD N-terminal domain-containing protein n=1 Tax=Archaeoglobus fulgidus TaxID=2234 RepID=A0A7J3M1D9_ARCFL